MVELGIGFGGSVGGFRPFAPHLIIIIVLFLPQNHLIFLNLSFIAPFLPLITDLFSLIASLI